MEALFKKKNYKNQQILRKILTKEEYIDICNCTECEQNFLDIEEERNIEKNIKYGIQDYIKLKNAKLMKFI